MAIVGLNITQIDVKRTETPAAQVNINNNIGIKSVETKDLSLGLSSQRGLKFTFEFVTSFEPNIGHIKFIGHVLYMDDEKKVQDIYTHWTKDKHIPGAIMESVLNAALRRSNIESLKLSQDVGLPSPIPLPKLTAKPEPATGGKTGSATKKSNK